MVSLGADEHIPQAIIEGLRARGIEVIGVAEEPWRGATDHDLLTRFHQDGRILLTNDRDFLRLTADRDHAGIIFVTSQHAGIGEVVRAVVRLVDVIPADGFSNNVFFVP